MKLKEKHFSEVSFITSSIHYLGRGGRLSYEVTEKKNKGRRFIAEDNILPGGMMRKREAVTKAENIRSIQNILIC